MPKHEFMRVRQNVVRRTLRVVAKRQLTPHMLSIDFHSDELAGFSSPSSDDHIKIFLPVQTGGTVARDFTPRAFDEGTKTLTLDFALHPQGPAVDWAQRAQVGDDLEIGGPKGSSIAPNDFAWYLLVGDATALPAIARRLQELPLEATVQVIVLVEGAAEESYLDEVAPSRSITWLHSTGSHEQDQQLWRAALERTVLPQGDGFVWIAAETSLARFAYRYIVDTRVHPVEWIKAAGYWSAGKADAGERIR